MGFHTCLFWRGISSFWSIVTSTIIHFALTSLQLRCLGLWQLHSKSVSYSYCLQSHLWGNDSFLWTAIIAFCSKTNQNLICLFLDDQYLFSVWLRPVESEAKWQPNSIETGWQWMNTRNGYCQMKKTVPRPNADCAKGVSLFPTWEQEPWKVMHRGKSTKVWCFMWQKELLPSRTIWRSQKKQKPQH